MRMNFFSMIVMFIAFSMIWAQEAKNKEGGKMNSTAKVIKGQCHCGACSYEYKGEVVKSTYCDCKACQKATGGLKVPYVTVLTSAFTMKAGELKKFNDPKGEKCDAHGEFYYCSKCNSPVYWKGFSGPELDILAGTLDDKEVFKPKE